jgi:hypothetical protein
LSFSPFLGGKGVCLGKTFAETISKITGPNLIWNFDFSFVDEKHMTFKPWNNLGAMTEPEIFVKITKAKYE